MTQIKLLKTRYPLFNKMSTNTCYTRFISNPVLLLISLSPEKERILEIVSIVSRYVCCIQNSASWIIHLNFYLWQDCGLGESRCTTTYIIHNLPTSWGRNVLRNFNRMSLDRNSDKIRISPYLVSFSKKEKASEHKSGWIPSVWFDPIWFDPSVDLP